MLELPVGDATRERYAGCKTSSDLAHEVFSPRLGTDGMKNLMTLLGELQVPVETL
jgi:hypothetical protein